MRKNSSDEGRTGSKSSLSASKLQVYSVSDLEVSIDSLRQKQDWTAVSSLIKRYAHVFDIGCASDNGDNLNGERSRAYYWVVMAEVMIHHNKDLQNAGFCVIRSAERDAHFSPWRILLVKILLLRTKKLNSDSTANSMSNDAEQNLSTQKSLKDFSSNSSEGIQMNSFETAMKELDVEEKTVIQRSLESFKVSHQKAILSAFSALGSDEILRIFMEVLVRLNQVQSAHQDLSPKEHWIYAICKKVLQNIHISDYYEHYLEKQLSDYNFWMILDAINTRSIIREISGDLQQARSDIQQLIHVVVKQYPHSLINLPAPIRNSLLFACCRLPVLERNMSLPSASLNSFRFCVSGDSIIAPHLMDSVKIALCMTAANMMVKVAFPVIKNKHFIDMNVKVCHINEQKEKGISDGNQETVEDMVGHAYMLLAHAKNMLDVVLSADESVAEAKLVNSSVDFITQQPCSLICDIKSRLGLEYKRYCKSDPENLLEASPAGPFASEHVSILLASTSKYLTGKKSNIVNPLDVLTWAMSVSVKPPYDLLWNVAQEYLSPNVNKINESVSLMLQCSDSMSVSKEQSRAIYDRCEMSSLLGLGVQIHKYPALPAMKCALTCLYGLGHPRKAIEVAIDGLLHNVGKGGKRFVSLLLEKLRSCENNSNKFAPVADTSSLSWSLISSWGGTAISIFQLMLIIAKSFAALGRCSQSGHIDCQVWSKKSCQVFHFLESTEIRDMFDDLQVSDKDDWSFEDSFYEKCRYEAHATFVLDFCTLLSEIGLISTSKNRLQLFLDETQRRGVPNDISNHLHLLVLLKASLDHSDSSLECISICDKVTQLCATKSSIHVANAQLTLARLHWKRTKYEDSIAVLHNIIRLVKSNPPVTDHFFMPESSLRFPFQLELLKTGILVECSELFRQHNDLDLAQQCIEDAWLVLYSPDLIQTIRKSADDKSSFSDEDMQPMNFIEAKRIDACRGIPTLIGWRLPSGMGWGMADSIEKGHIGKCLDDDEEMDSIRITYTSFEADLLAQCAQIAISRLNHNQDEEKYRAIRDILGIALEIDVNHIQSKLILATINLDTFERRGPDCRNVDAILPVCMQMQEVIRQNRKVPEAW